VRPESTLPAEVPKVLGNLLKAYAGMRFEYDARGNLVRKRTPAGEQEYEWDAFNRLLSARVAETSRQSEARYFYDAFGRRIAKEVNGERTVFGWDGDTLAYESDGERGTHYIYEPGTFVPLAQYVAEPVLGIETPEWKSSDRYVPEDDPLQKVPQRRADAKLFYYHCDQIGTPQLLTDEDGDVVWEASYKAWGEAREVIARASKAAGIVARNSLRFQGQQEDEETGLHYNRHRYYDSSIGRFTSQDPVGVAGGINLFRHTANPTQWIDPLGLTPCAGKAVIRHYDTGSRTGHYTVEVQSPTASVHTHQVITGDTTTTVVNERRERLMVGDPILHTTEVPLPNANAAIAYQQAQIGRQLGQYDERSNSCVDHVANVLRAGGENVPSGPLGQSRYLTQRGFKMKVR